ncbi:MAG TPA: four helix bundle protein [Flavisolibacter sp.]|nr:four helix bundle protein [Flavisolibacter sp.]
MSTIQRFEDLEIWQLARDLARKVYEVTFLEPVSKDFRYKDQLRGSCGSIMDNIAEGFGRGSKLEFINALTIAKGEAEELKSQLYRGLDVNYLSNLLFQQLYDQTEAIARKIGALINYLNKSPHKGQKFKERR